MTDNILRIGEAGLQTSDARVKVLMDNMVNAKTPGFRKADVLIRSFPLLLKEADARLQGEEPKVEGVYYNHAPGTLVRTGGATDLAIGGDGFFVVTTPWGEGYTRDGRFTLDKDGRLVTVSGNHLLLGRGGPIMVMPGTKVEFTQTGDVRVDDMIADRIRVVNFDNPRRLELVGGNIFRNPGIPMWEVETPRVIQGYVESSNVNIIDSMMELIYLSRAYGVNAKVISSRDAVLTRALEMGRRD